MFVASLSVDHNILCKKLEYYGLRGKINQLILSYLINRSQYVSISGINSNILNLICGVPQGSSLGTLLFLIYINHFRVCLNECSAGNSADDTFIMCHSRKPKTIETIINTELILVNNWLNLNKLSLNTGETEFIFFHSPRHDFDYSKLSIKFRGKKTTHVGHIRYLGFI